MGWSGGTEIFDGVTAELIELSHKWTGQDNHVDFMEPLKVLVARLEDQDWDVPDESSYWTHPIIGKILGNKFEEGDDELA